jgi:alpha-L-rhamnosidase
MANNERIYGDLVEQTWHTTNCDDSLWKQAMIQSLEVKMLPVLNPWKLAPRPIPMLPEIPKRFSGPTKCSRPTELQAWKRFLSEDIALPVPANAVTVVDIDASVLTTGFLSLKFRAGAGSKIRVLCSEGYENDLGVDKSPFPLPRGKADRSNHESGRLYGTEDFYIVGDISKENVFEPFWFRTFRYIQLEIICGNEDLILLGFQFRETHYPLEISTSIEASSPEMESMWNISLRTLKNCMHETYEDCPFYEQNQFASDARLQMLFTYTLSSDDRLARKTLEELHASRCPDGLILAQFPAGFKAFQIPQFSLYYVLMLHDHMQYFGDKSLVRRYISTVDGILNYFDSRLNDLGLVGQFDEENWAFVDWVDEWTTPRQIKKSCMPPAYWTAGAATVNSLLYSMALLHAADIAEFIGRQSTAEEYRQRSKDINDAVNRHSFEAGIYLDGPGVEAHSQHTQVFAVLSGAITGSAATVLMERTLKDPSLAKCSYAMKFYLFRAVERVGLYASSFVSLMEPWRKMIGENLTTWAENDTSPRSDCHGWSSCPIYEIVAGVFGLRPGDSGFRRVVIEPKMDLLDVAKASLWTPRGIIAIAWSSGKALTLQASKDMEVEIRFNGSNSVIQLVAGQSHEWQP